MTVEAAGLGWTWADGRRALAGIDLRVRAGERVLITGPSGSGKSTLLRLLCGLLPGHGEGSRTGALTVAGADPAVALVAERAARVGVVFQDPGDQLVTGRVRDEVAFGAISAGRTPDVEGWLERVGLAIGLDRDPAALSGGQQQRLAVAAGLAAGAPLLALDEPLAHLDPDGADRLLRALDALAGEGRAVLLVEHRLDDALPWADRVVVLRDGRVAWDGPNPPSELLAGDGLRVPAWSRVLEAGGLDALAPVEPPERVAGPEILRLRSPALTVAGRAVLRDVDLALRAGEALAVVGPNGAGKSTLLAALEAEAGRRAVLVPQDPDLALFCPTVREELAYGPRDRGQPSAVAPDAFGLGPLLDGNPQALSRGQRLRVAVAAAASVGPEILLLDEPTAGQHADAVRATLRAVREARPGGALVFATHDAGLALEHADRVIVLGGGQILEDGPPERALLRVPLPPLQRAQAARGWPLAPVDRQLAARSGPRGPSPGAARATPVPEPDVPESTPEGGRRPIGYGAVCAVVGVGALAVLLDRPLSLGALAAVSLLAWGLGAPPASWGRAAALAVGVVWSTVLSQGLFYGDLPRTALVRVGPVALWAEGVTWGLVQSLRLVAVGAAGLALARRAPPDRLLELLRGFGVPGGFAFLAITALRSAPTVAAEWGTVRRARDRRGRPILPRSPASWLRTELLALRPVASRALRRARLLAEALESRGFSPAVERGRAPPWTAVDRVVGASVAGVVGFVAFAQLATGLYVWDVARHPSLTPLYAWVRAWL